MAILNIDAQSPPEQILSGASLTVGLPRLPSRYFHHGWQSWSLAAWTAARPLPAQRPALLQPMQIDPAYAHHPHPHGSWVGAVEIAEGKILLLGSLGLDAHVDLNGAQLRGWYEADLTGDWFIGHGDERSVFERYAMLLGDRLGRTKSRPAPRVWCSWYSFYTAIDETRLYRVFDALGDLPFDVLQVDDGWQMAIGDWEVNRKFPAGMRALAGRIKSTGRRAGLWLAPLIAVQSSKLFKVHRDWFLRDRRGKLVSAGFNWGEQLYAIDTTHPEASNWLASLMRQVRTWGFDYFKLDFLYGGALPGKRFTEMPREAAYRNGLKILRAGMGAEAFFLTCGAPILPSLGLCDALRIGPDTAGEWESHRDAVLLRNPTTPGAKNALRTALHRRWLNPLLRVDPDVAYFRSMDCTLTGEQKSLMQDLALICNFKATSDLPQWLTDKERGQLRKFLEESPAVQQTGAYTYRIDGREVDFRPALDLPEPPKGRDAVSSVGLGWLAGRKMVMNIYDKLNKNDLKKKGF